VSLTTLATRRSRYMVAPHIRLRRRALSCRIRFGSIADGHQHSSGSLMTRWLLFLTNSTLAGYILLA
jgi:hypothetical protein